MKAFMRLVVIFQIVLIHRIAAQLDWGYEESAGILPPNKWYQKYPKCGDRMQSPVNIVNAAVKAEPNFYPIQFFNYEKPLTNLIVTNRARSMVVTIPKWYELIITSQSLPAPYKLAQFHFHWPSEHTINGYNYPLELHMVHFNTKVPENMTMIDPTGIAVIAVMFDLAKDGRSAKTLQTLLSVIPDVASEDQSTILKTAVVLDDLLPRNRDGYLQYTGSLTIPQCQQVVTFSIFTTTMSISESDLRRFSMLRYRQNIQFPGQAPRSIEASVAFNNRPTQALNGRKIRLFGELGDMPIGKNMCPWL